MRSLHIVLTLAILAAPTMLFADEASSVKEGFKQVHQGMKKVTKSVDKKAKKDLKTVDKTAKKTWKKAGQDIKKATSD